MTTSNGCRALAVKGTSVVVWMRCTAVPRASSHVWKSEEGFDPGFPRMAMLRWVQEASAVPGPPSRFARAPPVPPSQPPLDEAPPNPDHPAAADPPDADPVPPSP